MLRFHGYSDDTFGEYGWTNIDHDNCGSGTPIIFRVAAFEQAVLVIGQYNKYHNGCWSIEVVQERNKEDDPDSIPDWPMQISFHPNGYTAVLEIEVPDVFTITDVTDVE